MDTNVLITGATSYIAVKLICRLIEAGCTVYAVVRPGSINMKRLPRGSHIRVVTLDMKDINSLLRLKLPHFEAIYHFAWEGVRGDLREDGPLQEKNLLETKQLIDAACEMEIPYFIGIGSQAEYGLTAGKITEHTVLKPVTEYGKSKALAYRYGMEKVQTGRITFIWARIFSVYGEEDDKRTLLMQCVEKMLRNEEILLTPCEHLWDYTYVSDAAEALFLMFYKKPVSGAYNVSSGQARRLKDYVLQVREITGSDSYLNFGAIPYGSAQPVQMNPDVGKLKDSTGWLPETAFEDGIQRIVKRILQNEKN